MDALGQAILALSAINEVTNRIEQRIHTSLVLVQSLGGAGGYAGGIGRSGCDITDLNADCHYDPTCGCEAPYADLSPVGKALADGKIGFGQTRDAARDAVAPVINDRANDARDAARDTARDAISDRVSDRR